MLASSADGFSHGGNGGASGVFRTSDDKYIEIREVWAYNLEEEIEKICEVIQKYPYVAMDTEFPGVVARPVGDYGSNDMQYQTLRCNVDMLKLIQLGLSFSDKDGNWAPGCACWQFNFKFSLSGDMFAEDSIELLKTSGIDFEKSERSGIDVQYFGEVVMMSGLILSDEVKWVSFHSSYDFGYLLKTLTCTSLPQDEAAFLDLLHTYFPCIFDVKFMMTAVEGLHGGLSGLADTLQVERIGPMHQAGSDSLLTAQTYFSLIGKHFGGVCDESRFRGELFGLGNNYTKYKGKQSQPAMMMSQGYQTTHLEYNNGVHYGHSGHGVHMSHSTHMHASHSGLGGGYQGGSGYHDDHHESY